MFEWEWRDLHEASFLSDSLLVQVAMSSAGHNVGLCHANACNSENIHVTSIIQVLSCNLTTYALSVVSDSLVLGERPAPTKASGQSINIVGRTVSLPT